METTEQERHPETLAKYFKFFKQDINPFLRFKLGFSRIPFVHEYKGNSKYYDKLWDICEKYGIDKKNFVKFCVVECCIKNARDMVSAEMFNRYANKLKIVEQYRKIYDNYIKSANYIAEKCIIQNIGPKEYIRRLIIEGKIGSEYVSGNISKHFFASIQNFKEIYFKFDNISQDEMRIIYLALDELNQTVQDVFLMFKNTRVHPIRFVEEQINKIKTTTNNKE